MNIDKEIHVTAACSTLGQLSSLIGKYDPELFVCIEDLDAALGANVIAKFYNASYSPDEPVVSFCQRVQKIIIRRHGLEEFYRASMSAKNILVH